jgi:hypothetical protein
MSLGLARAAWRGGAVPEGDKPYDAVKMVEGTRPNRQIVDVILVALFIYRSYFKAFMTLSYAEITRVRRENR